MPLVVFDNGKSKIHFLLGILAVYLGPVLCLALTVIYVSYQFVTSKNFYEAIGDLVEFLAGLGAGLLSLYVISALTGVCYALL